MKKFISISILILFIFSLCGCKDNKSENMPKNEIEMTTLESAIKGAIKARLITEGAENTDFEDEILPNYRSIFLSDVSTLNIPDEYDLTIFDDGVAVIHKSADNSDLIAIAKVKDGKQSAAEGLALRLRDFQMSMADSYLPNQTTKIENNIIKAIGNYIIYITYSDPKYIEEAILKVIQ